MGNTSPKTSSVRSSGVDGVYIQRRDDLCQNLESGASGRSFGSVNSFQSNYSGSRLWSRLSRRRWKESTLVSLTLPKYESSKAKTSWPVSQSESLFLPEFPLAPADKANKFENLGELGSGAFGKVYKVRHGEAVYALKILLKFKIIKENAVRQVKEEVQIQRVCGHHAFIVNCPYHWQSKRRLYIVSEYVAGGELYDLLKTYAVLPVALVKLYVAQLALALDFLHNAGVIYRDLKPENVLLDDDGNVQLIDFGLSKWLSYGKTTRTFCGTLLYMAPEILGGREYGHPIDWWGLGVISCAMLTGEYPSPETDSGLQTKTARLPATGLDVASRDLLARLLQIDPASRLRSLRSLQNIAFFQNYNFEEVKARKVRPRDLLPEAPAPEVVEFSDFDQNFDTLL